MTTSSSAARNMVSSRASKAKTDAPSQVAWETVLDRLRTRSKRWRSVTPSSTPPSSKPTARNRPRSASPPSRTVICHRAGILHSKMHWMRLQPDLRASVIVKLARALEVKPEEFFRAMIAESWTDERGEVHFSGTPSKP